MWTRCNLPNVNEGRPGLTRDEFRVVEREIDCMACIAAKDS